MANVMLYFLVTFPAVGHRRLLSTANLYYLLARGVGVNDLVKVVT